MRTSYGKCRDYLSNSAIFPRFAAGTLCKREGFAMCIPNTRRRCKKRDEIGALTRGYIIIYQYEVKSAFVMMAVRNGGWVSVPRSATVTSGYRSA